MINRTELRDQAEEGGEQEEHFRVLLVDDSAEDLDLMERELQDWGLQVEGVRARGRQEFLRALGGPAPNLVITDYVLPDLDGLDVLDRVRQRWPQVPVIVVTGAVDERTAMACIRAGAADYVLKDHLLRLPIAALNALEKARAQGRLMHVVGISQDITSEKEMEAQVRQRQKLETVGQLAGGIAHDMNNILTAVVNFTALARDGLEPHQALVQEDLAQVETAAHRGVDLIRKLMDGMRAV